MWIVFNDPFETHIQIDTLETVETDSIIIEVCPEIVHDYDLVDNIESITIF